VAGLSVDFSLESPLWERFPAAREVICGAAAAVAAHEGVGGALAADHQVSMVLGDDALARELNARWRQKDSPTNVLSFPSAFPASGDGGRLLGDVILAFETIEREAKENGTPFADHVAHLTVHGILHLLGHDHVEDEDAARMEALETRILKSLGISDPYAAQAV
jgi:probable rRNA maturation factor